MANIYMGTLELIGNTPLVEVTNIEKNLKLEATLLVKLEYFNPAGSVKDRIAKAMIEDAEEKGILKPDSVIIEPTSGNTGIGLAAIAAAKGYRMILTMPETMSVERRNILKAYDGMEALEILKRNNDIQLIILDIMMPHIDGITLAKKIREDYAFPVIMLSAKSEDYDKTFHGACGKQSVRECGSRNRFCKLADE